VHARLTVGYVLFVPTFLSNFALLYHRGMIPAALLMPTEDVVVAYSPFGVLATIAEYAALMALDPGIAGSVVTYSRGANG
jgi:hypothetical protein